MTDIVKRLRADAESTDDIGLCADAADVIDALRQQLAEEHEAHLQAEQRWIEELNAAKADDLFAMRLLAESQAREKMLRDELFELANLHVVVYSQSPEGRAYMKKLGDLMASTDDTALQDLILKERTRAVDTYKHLQQELVLKAALAAERERCAKVCESFKGAKRAAVFNGELAKCAFAIRALGD